MIAFSDFAVLFPLLTFVLLSALQRVIKKYNASPHPINPSNKQRKAYGSIKMQMTTSLFDLVRMTDPADVITSANPISMESVGQVCNVNCLYSLFLTVQRKHLPTHHGMVYYYCPLFCIN